MSRFKMYKVLHTCDHKADVIAKFREYSDKISRLAHN